MWLDANINYYMSDKIWSSICKNLHIVQISIHRDISQGQYGKINGDIRYYVHDTYAC